MLKMSLKLRILSCLLFLSSLGLALEQAPEPREAGVVSIIPVTKVIAEAALDAASLPPEIAKRTRYLDARTIYQNKENYGILCYHINSLSREAELVPLRKVTAWLWSFNLDDYRYPSEIFGALREVNHYYSVKVVNTATKEVEFIPNPLFKDLQTLSLLTKSQNPLFRADQFLVATGAQADRTGFGYFDILQLKSRKDAEKLAKLDIAAAIEVYREQAAIIPQSGVALNNRQLFRYRTITGSWWRSKDTKKSVDKSVAIANFLDDFAHDAEEIVFTLPNRLPGYYICDAQGVQVDSVPDSIASDSKSGNNDHRIHVPYSCIGCHVDSGLIPYTDYARALYNEDTKVSLAGLAIDPISVRRLKSVYLGPLQEGYAEDKLSYSTAITKISGMKPLDVAKGYRRVWAEYLDIPLTAQKAALELGVSVATMRERFTEYSKTKGVLDPVFVGLIKPNGPPIRREYWENRYTTALLIMQGVNP